MHSLSGLEASQVPEAIMGIEQRKATKFRTAVMLLATPMVVGFGGRKEKIEVMFIQTLPDMVQSRILSFLAFDHERFCKRDLSMLARSMLTDNKGVDFWVKRSARHLLDEVSESNYQWISGLSLDSEEQKVDEEFESLPGWLKSMASADDSVFPWLPLSPDELNSRELFGSHENEQHSLSEAGEGGGLEEVVVEMEVDRPVNAPLALEIQNRAASLRAQVLNFESRPKTVQLANEICQLCLEKGVDSFAVLGLIEPWKADDEIASLLISHLSNVIDQDELALPSQILSSIILPRFLILEEPASRVLVTATIDYCKLYQRAAEYALLFPLIMRIGGINNPLCDVITRIVKECLHPVHVSSFCQKLLCAGEDEKRFICLPCHQCLISHELVQELAQRFSKSLRFGNFLLCFITKCSLLLKSHKLLLADAVKQTNTLVTKSILSKLATF
ncbi:hypothetical protein GH714_001014 [Hevea brasiliensis]|uniref:Uncharacterized protein n=1 Tax=Hevea brasiliensis TaxID=3981 RepID=A0A6A6KXU9_HEVBR|nr:hypothetical protein GH714_001014 [Hevea brasiliensis]